jgi:hypothetical protein
MDTIPNKYSLGTLIMSDLQKYILVDLFNIIIQTEPPIILHFY